MRGFVESFRGLRAAALALAALVVVAGCATLSPDYEQPTVALTSFRALPSEGVAPAFEVGLRIVAQAVFFLESFPEHDGIELLNHAVAFA